ncbi:MAG: hypothetical protein KF708_07950 [Pirellulales bacterium]|nr:hypothetical protein [Pirellulales bacterium]
MAKKDVPEQQALSSDDLLDQRIVRICEYFFEHCRAIAAKRLGKKFQRRTSPDSVVRSAQASLIRDARLGRLTDRTDLELVQALFRKVRDKSIDAYRQHMAECRSVDKEVHNTTVVHPSRESDPSEIAIAREMAEQVMQDYSHDDNAIRRDACLAWFMSMDGAESIRTSLLAVYGSATPSVRTVGLYIKHAKARFIELLGDSKAG